MGNSISNVQAMIAALDKGQEAVQPAMAVFDKAIRTQDTFDPMLYSQISLRVRLNDCEVRAIPERVKDKVLEWALALERAGVKGDGMMFKVEESQIAQAVIFNLSGCHIEQMSNSGTNYKGS
jgi:AbiTii